MPFDFPCGLTVFLDSLFQAACGQEPTKQETKEQETMVNENQVLRKQNQYSFFSVTARKATILNVYLVCFNSCWFSLRKGGKYWANNLAGVTISDEMLFLLDLAEIVFCELSCRNKLVII